MSHPILSDIRSFHEFGTATQEIELAGIPYFINEFWTSQQRKGHPLHEVSFRACFKPQLPNFFITRLSQPGEVVNDPFLGRGTTAIEAGLLGRIPAGSDLNPLSLLLARPRLNPPSQQDVFQRLNSFALGQGEIEDSKLLAFYHEDTLRELCDLKKVLGEKAPISDLYPDPVLDWIRMVALNRLSGHSIGFLSVRSMPPDQAISVKAQEKINAKRGQVPDYRSVQNVILKKSASLLRQRGQNPQPPARFAVASARSTPHLDKASVALTVTSPPFLDTVNYAADNWLRMWFAGIDPALLALDHHKGIPAWAGMVRDCLVEQARVVRPGGHVAFEVGEANKGKEHLERTVWAVAEGLPFERVGVMVNQQEFTKTAHCWGVDNNAKGTNSNRIVILRRL